MAKTEMTTVVLMSVTRGNVEQLLARIVMFNMELELGLVGISVRNGGRPFIR